MLVSIGVAAPSTAAPSSGSKFRSLKGVCGKAILDSGTTYVLENDIGPCASDGLIFKASKATLDLNGHSIFGTPLVPDGSDPDSSPDGGFGEGVGIRLVGNNNVTITNSKWQTQTSTIRDFDAGIVLQQGQNNPARFNTVTNIRVFSNVGLQGAPPFFLGGSSCNDPAPEIPCEVTDFNDGISLVGAENNTIGPNNVVEGNGSGGIRIDNARGNTITGNTIQDNLGNGVRFMAQATSNLVTGNMIRRNASGVNFSFENPANTIEDNTLTLNRAFGVATSYHGEGTVIHHNTISLNRSGGIQLASGQNVITSNQVLQNGFGASGTGRGNGIFVGSGTDNFPRVGTRVEGNTVTGNAGNGVRINCMSDQDPDNFAIYGCLVWDTHNQVLGNTATGNGVNGPNGNQSISGGQVIGWYDLLDSTNTLATQSPFDPSGLPLTNCSNNTWNDNTYGTAFPACAGA